MRIIHTTPFYYLVISGVKEVVKRIAEYTASRGYEIYAVTYNRASVSDIGSPSREENINNIHIIKLKLYFQRSYHSLVSHS